MVLWGFLLSTCFTCQASFPVGTQHRASQDTSLTRPGSRGPQSHLLPLPLQCPYLAYNCAARSDGLFLLSRGLPRHPGFCPRLLPVRSFCLLLPTLKLARIDSMSDIAEEGPNRGSKKRFDRGPRLLPRQIAGKLNLLWTRRLY